MIHFAEASHELLLFLDVAVLLLLDLEDGAIDLSTELDLHLLSVEALHLLSDGSESLLLILSDIRFGTSGHLVGLLSAKQLRQLIEVCLGHLLIGGDLLVDRGHLALHMHRVPGAAIILGGLSVVDEVILSRLGHKGFLLAEIFWDVVQLEGNVDAGALLVVLSEVAIVQIVIGLVEERDPLAGLELKHLEVGLLVEADVANGLVLVVDRDTQHTVVKAVHVNDGLFDVLDRGLDNDVHVHANAECDIFGVDVHTRLRFVVRDLYDKHLV